MESAESPSRSIAYTSSSPTLPYQSPLPGKSSWSVPVCSPESTATTGLKVSFPISSLKRPGSPGPSISFFTETHTGVQRQVKSFESARRHLEKSRQRVKTEKTTRKLLQKKVSRLQKQIKEKQCEVQSLIKAKAGQARAVLKKNEQLRKTKHELASITRQFKELETLHRKILTLANKRKEKTTN